ncbi:MAG: polysaccharide biosynthesis/export family protein [Verrucomicrobia bacterium]|nr:polysaccharide biosynthesis/export family protein [Verrucomicrobiota bacterium]
MSEKILAAAFGLLGAGMFLLSGCATTSDPLFASDAIISPAAAGDPANPPTFTPTGGVIFQVGDLVIVTFSDTPDPIQPHEERIKDDGTITLPLIGAVKAVGKSPGDLQKKIHESYVPKYFVRLTVTVKYQTQELSYSVLGEVNQRGPKPYLGLTTLTKAIGAAGGLTDYANKRKILLTRANGTKIKVNYKKAIEDPQSDPQIFPGDSINVYRSLW